VVDDAPEGGAVDRVAARLREQGYRVTGPRMRVYEALGDDPRHLTADELADRLAGDAEPVPLSSVYRALAVLEELGLVRATRLGSDDVTHWERAHPDEHFHVVCTSCGAVEHHRGSLVEFVADHLRAGHGFAVEAVTLLVHGTCAVCGGIPPEDATPLSATAEVG
jgi:Fur family ferric uptake transcriptional regulator